MRSLVAAALSLVVIGLSFVASFRMMNAMQVHNDAEIVLDAGVCPIALNDAGSCIVRGNLTHTLITGNAEITLPTGRVLNLPAERLEGVVFELDKIHYEPFGKAVSGVIGFAVLVAGVFLSLSISAAGMKTAWSRLRLIGGK